MEIVLVYVLVHVQTKLICHVLYYYNILKHTLSIGTNLEQQITNEFD